MYNKTRGRFLLDENIVFLNHGSFGACTKSVFKEYQKFQKQFESHPVHFVEQEISGLLAESRAALSKFLSVDPKDIVLIPNPTTALNEIVRSLDIKPGDEILTTNHEYGAMSKTWEFITEKTGAGLKSAKFPLPILSQEYIVEKLISEITPMTRIIFISHITSPTAMIFPVKKVCEIAKERGIISIIDGAHAPGQIPLDIFDINPDFYIGTCHKWLCAPKGTSFMYIRETLQKSIEPLVVGWGWRDDTSFLSPFISNHEWWGTQDLASYFCIPKTLEVFEKNFTEIKRKHCRKMVVKFRRKLNKITGESPICPENMLGQMAALILPDVDPTLVKSQLIGEHNIEVPVFIWEDETLLRISCQIYNDEDDITALETALKNLMNNP